MQRLKIEDSQADEDALLEKAIKLAATEKEALKAADAKKEETNRKLAKKHGDGCCHGYVKTEDYFIIKDFAKIFLSGFVNVGSGEYHMTQCFEVADKATTEKYPEVWEDPSKLKQVMSFFIANGTQQALKGNIVGARIFASIACYVEEYAICLHKRKALPDLAKMMELLKADENTLVKYLRKNIPCNCLDGKYKEVKSITKTGLCFNPQCQVPDGMVERRTMLYCTRCCLANYCSPECQKAAWPEHKEMCDKIVDHTANWDSRK